MAGEVTDMFANSYWSPDGTVSPEMKKRIRDIQGIKINRLRTYVVGVHAIWKSVGRIPGKVADISLDDSTSAILYLMEDPSFDVVPQGDVIPMYTWQNGQWVKKLHTEYLPPQPQIFLLPHGFPLETAKAIMASTEAEPDGRPPCTCPLSQIMTAGCTCGGR